MLEFIRWISLLSCLTSKHLSYSATDGKSNSSCSKISEFRCHDGTCISSTKRCDDARDCPDGSDEWECTHFYCKEPNWFRCDNRKCVSSLFVCDSANDCGDFSDEKNCGEHTVSAAQTPSNCSSTEWRCKDKLCIPVEWVCNGDQDCLDGSDEILGCDEHLPCKGFKCKSGQCIVEEWRCDGSPDCRDGSDETDCATKVGCDLQEELFHCADNKSCIKINQKCDGIAQCNDYSDETTSCLAINASCKTLNCSHDCVTLRYGSRCICPDGYYVDNATKCEDIDECEIYGICDQKCENTPGSYRCHCEKGYELKSDNKTCKARNGEALMIFSTKNQIRGYLLETQLYFPIIKRLHQAIGVAYDKHYVYWTEIFAGNESIVRASQDGSRVQAVVTTGLGTPEDLAIDWITGNIYFTDTEMHHIGVCTNDGMYCAVLIEKGVDRPRSIVLNPLDGEMFWTDWGKRPEIARARMDGTQDIAFVTNRISWPNGLALDHPNERLYWADAKLNTIESIRLDGTARRIIFRGIVQHPYSLAVFEDRMFWSDWGTRSLESCNKFTGRDHHILLKLSREIYGIHIFHSTLQKPSRNPCEFTFCSDICLLSGKGYSCACPSNKVLATDRHTCKESVGKQRFIIASKDRLWLAQYEELGQHNISEIRTSLRDITAVTYNDLNNSLFISDASSNSLVEMKLPHGDITYLPIDNTHRYITDMAFDSWGNNLYWCDSKNAVVEVFSLTTMSTKTILSDMQGEVPMGIAVVPEEGTIFVTFQSSSLHSHIDRFHIDGKDRRHVIERGLLGPVQLFYDHELHRIYWIDASAAIIQSTSADGDDKHHFRTLNNAPITITSLKNKILWASNNSKLFWATKNGDEDINRKLAVELPENVKVLRMVSVTPTKIKPHPCKQNNGNCSHICLATVGATICECPLGMKLQTDQKTCYKPSHCDLNEFFCTKSNMCIDIHLRCNKRQDCTSGEDEDHCEDLKKPKECSSGYFQCRNGDCIKQDLICDNHSDCKDSSDEDGCLFKNNTCGLNDLNCINKHCREGICGEMATVCGADNFRCKSGMCIPKHWECDRQIDCPDTSDEHEKCDYNSCPPLMFQCRNGLCINLNFKCNNADDCGDFSDEEFCHTTSKCKDKEFYCHSSSLECLPLQVRCNRTAECPHREDEQGCSDCHINQFECRNKRCISRDQICNRVDDCGDNSDEDKNFCSHINCKDSEFSCSRSNLKCLPKAVRCNGTSECPHHEDEQGCSNCLEDQFECNNQKCVSKRWLCNNVDECGDNSDEDPALCSYPECKDYEFQCTESSFQCISILARCNGSSECPHHEDELGCSPCHGDEFECMNKNCIPQQWVCDYSDDCGDDSDENLEFCSHQQSYFLPNKNVSCTKGFRCKNGKCIDMHLVCNNVDNCGDDTDENGACLESCSVNNNPCTQICQKTPSGPQCYCKSGYKLVGDGHTCSDIKECSLEPPVCSQVCDERTGSFECSCYGGYMLRADRRSCKSLYDTPMSVIYAIQNKIYQYFPTNNSLEVIYSNDDIRITEIDVSIDDGLVYFLTEQPGSLSRKHIGHHAVSHMQNMLQPQHLSVDWITQNVYLVDNNLVSKSIRVCNFETKYCSSIINFNINSKITALTVDAINKYLFYSVANLQAINHPSIIYRSRLDGSNQKLIYRSINDIVSGITFDLHKKTLYYLDQLNGMIGKIQYDGLRQTNIIDNLNSPANPTVFDDHLYFYVLHGYLTACPLFKDYKACRSYKLHGHFNENYLIAHSSKQPNVRNACRNNTCSDLCIANDDNAQCLCNSESTHHIANNCELMKISQTSFIKASHAKDENRKGSSTILTVLLIIGACAAIASLTTYYYCYKRKTGNMSISFRSMRFHNPIYGFIHDSSSQEVVLQPGQHEYYNPLTNETDDIQTAKELNKGFVL